MDKYFLVAFFLSLVLLGSFQDIYVDEVDQPIEKVDQPIGEVEQPEDSTGTRVIELLQGPITKWMTFSRRILTRSKPRFDNILDQIRYYHLG